MTGESGKGGKRTLCTFWVEGKGERKFGRMGWFSGGSGLSKRFRKRGT